MKKAFDQVSYHFRRLSVFLLALLLLVPQALAVPTQPTVELTHSGDGDRILLECTAQVAPPDGDSDYRVSMTLAVQAASSLTIDTSSIQAIYQAEDGETTVLDQDNWTADQSSGLLVAALDVDTDMGGQLQCRVKGSLAPNAQGTIVSTARLDVEYEDLNGSGLTTLSATGRDEIKRVLSYSLTLDLNGGSLSGKGSSFLWSEDLSEGQQINLADLPKPERTGYFFDGWTLASGSGAKLDAGALILGKGDVTLRAVWTSKADKLTLDLNGGSGKLVTVEGYTGDAVTIPMPSDVLYSRDGFKLAGWSTTPDGEGGKTYTGGESYTLTREDDVLYAWWAPQYTLSFDANGGTGQMPRRIFAASDPAVISENAFTRTGYKFIGWCLSADGRGALYQSGDTLKLTGNATLYAQWEKVYEEPVEEPTDSHLPLLLGILAALVAAGCVFGFLAWKRRRDDDGPYDDGLYDDYDERDRDGRSYDDREDRYDDRRDRYDDRRDRYDDRRDRYDDRRERYDDRRDRYDDRRDRYDDRRDRHDGRRDRNDDQGDRYDGRRDRNDDRRDRYDGRRDRNDDRRDRYDDDYDEQLD